MFEVLGYGVLGGMILADTYIFVRLARWIHRYKPSTLVEPSVPAVKPTVSVCIPARNEEHALNNCLERVLASDYERLEIIVLDDNSDDDTSVLIKAFAHEGVRFVAGKPLEPGWIGKNHALDTMARAASGSIVLFMDIDTLIEPKTISSVVNAMLSANADALSVVPMRRDIWRVSTLLGNMRYFWEILLSSRKSPLTSSGFWLIKRTVLLEKLNGFYDVSEYVQPEYPILAWVQEELTHRAVIGNRALGVYFEKKWLSQLETSQRTLYLLVRRSLGSAGLLFVAFVGWSLALPLFLLGLFAGKSIFFVTVATLNLILVLYSWFLYLRSTWSHGALIGMLLLPYTVVQELLLLLVSFVQYKLRRVTWKGRTLTAPPQNQTHLAIDE